MNEYQTSHVGGNYVHKFDNQIGIKMQVSLKST